jgi:hypothetical protein
VKPLVLRHVVVPLLALGAGQNDLVTHSNLSGSGFGIQHSGFGIRGRVPP